MTPRTRRPGYDVFISHSSADARLAFQLEAALQGAGLSAWLDRSDIRVGTLLRDELHASLKASRRLLLLWSKSAAASRWVAAELLTAFHEKRFIIPCVLDVAPLPYFLSNAIFLDFRKNRPAALARVPAVVRRAPSGRSRVPPFRDSPSPELRAATNALSGGQTQVTDALGRRVLAQARQRQASIDGAQRAAERKWRLDATVLSLGGVLRATGPGARAARGRGLCGCPARPPVDPLVQAGADLSHPARLASLGSGLGTRELVGFGVADQPEVRSRAGDDRTIGRGRRWPRSSAGLPGIQPSSCMSVQTTSPRR